MQKKIEISAKGIIAIYSRMVSLHLGRKFSLNEILLFRDRLQSLLSENEIPVRAGKISEEDLYLFYDVTTSRNGVKGSYNAYDVDKQVMDIMPLLSLPFVKDVITNVLQPLNITRWCSQAYTESI